MMYTTIRMSILRYHVILIQLVFNGIHIITESSLAQLHIQPRIIQQKQDIRIRFIKQIDDLTFVFDESMTRSRKGKRFQCRKHTGDQNEENA